MSVQDEKIHRMEDYKSQEGTDQYDNIPKEVLASTSKDMGKVALIISVMAVVLVAIFFFGLNQNLNGLTKEVQSLSTLKGDVADLQTGMKVVDGRLAELEKLPKKTRHLIIDQHLQEMAGKTQYLSGQLEDPEMSAKLMEAQKLLRQVQSGLVK